MIAWTFIALAAAQAAPARDLTATYTDGSRAVMKVEVSASGASRIDMGEGLLAYIRRDGHLYMVTGKGPNAMVANVDDLRAAAKETLEKTGPGICHKFEEQAIDTDLVKAGTVTVGGRTGDAWLPRSRVGKPDAKPEMVMSHDPALAPIGAALLEEYRASVAMLPDCPVFRSLMAPVETALASGTPIATKDVTLSEVREGPIDPARFELPARPRSVEELRAAAKDTGVEVRTAPSH